MQGKELIVGFDSAWTGRAPGAICILSSAGGRAPELIALKSCSFSQARSMILELAPKHGYTLIAVDQPLIVPNETGMRPVERVAGGLIGLLGGGVQPTNRAKTDLFGERAPIWHFLGELRPNLDPGVARRSQDGMHAIEVYPALALPSLLPELWERRALPKYNPKNPNFDIRDWRGLCLGLAQAADDLGLTCIAVAAHAFSNLPRPEKADQDMLDAMICTLIAWQWRHFGEANRMVCIGDGDLGYMVTPAAPGPREILEKAALWHRVAIGTEIKGAFNLNPAAPPYVQLLNRSAHSPGHHPHDEPALNADGASAVRGGAGSMHIGSGTTTTSCPMQKPGRSSKQEDDPPSKPREIDRGRRNLRTHLVDGSETNLSHNRHS